MPYDYKVNKQILQVEGFGVPAADSYGPAIAHDAENKAARLHLAVMHDFDLE